MGKAPTPMPMEISKKANFNSGNSSLPINRVRVVADEVGQIVLADPQITIKLNGGMVISTDKGK